MRTRGRRTDVRSGFAMRTIFVDGFDVWDGVLIDDVLYVKDGPTEAAAEERRRLVLLQLQSKSLRLDAVLN